MIRVLTHFTPSWKPLADITVPVLEKYCHKHHYKLSAFECTPYQQYNGKEKIKHILSELKLGDVALVMDADSIITNTNISLHNFINDHHDFYITKHVGNINAGVFIIRLSVWAIEFLNVVFSNIGKGGIHCEQDSMAKYIKEHPNDNRIKILAHPSINSFDYSQYPEHQDKIGSEEDWKPDHFVLHLPGVGMDRRLEILKNTTAIE